jgi:hypothetical protein
MKFRHSTVLVVLAAVCLLVAYCGGGTDSTAPDPTELSSVHTATYVGPGSAWIWDLKADGTAHVEHRPTVDAAADMTVEATYETLSTGFYKFTVTSAAGDNAPAVDSKAYGFAVPGVILMVKPMEEGSNIMMMPAVGTCPTATFDVNWVQVETADQSVEDLTTKAWWGNASIPTSGALTGSDFILDGTPASTGRTFATVNSCTDGIISITSDIEGTGFVTMTAAGVGLVETQDADKTNAIIAVPQDSSITTSAMNGKEFVGLVFDVENGGGKVRAMKVVFSASGTGTFTFIDPETGTPTGETGQVSAKQAGSGNTAGFLEMETATPNAQGEITKMWGAAVSDIGGSGRTFMFATGMGVNTGGTATHSFSMVVVEK